jgi:hypothetical protein
VPRSAGSEEVAHTCFVTRVPSALRSFDADHPVSTLRRSGVTFGVSLYHRFDEYEIRRWLGSRSLSASEELQDSESRRPGPLRR